MKKLYDKSELAFAILWIIIYCVSASFADQLSFNIGIEKIITAPLLLGFCIFILHFINKYNLNNYYGLCKSQLPPNKMLYYIPLLLLLSVNLWCGISLHLSMIECLLYIISMLCVGFLEEMIFRGFLFCAMTKDNIKVAIIVSSITFGIGHIINLLNGSNTDFILNLLQVIYAMAAGFMFVMIFYKSKSLLACIITHGLFNALSVFMNEINVSFEMHLISCVFMVIVSSFYAIYLYKQS